MAAAHEIAHFGACGDDLTAGLALLEALSQRPAWQARARCRGYGPSAFFRGADESAKATCRACEVRAECAEMGMGELEGVWGGLSERERRRLRRAAG